MVLLLPGYFLLSTENLALLAIAATGLRVCIGEAGF